MVVATTRATCFFDYTCGYSYRAWRWLSELAGVEVDWRTASLKELDRRDGEPSVFDEREQPRRSVLALALAHAARSSGHFERFHRATFHAMHAEQRMLGAQDLFDIAAGAGMDVAAFREKTGVWVDAAAAEHRAAVETWGVFGIPTLVLSEDVAVFLKFSEPPAAGEDARRVWESVHVLAVSHPELLEIKRPVR